MKYLGKQEMQSHGDHLSLVAKNVEEDPITIGISRKIYFMSW